jgi:hypothetical protein
MLWTEKMISFFPIDEKRIWQQMLARFGFLCALWFSGLLVHALDGLMTFYLSEMNIYLSMFGTFFLIFIGSYYVPQALDKGIQNFRSMLKLDDQQFQKFSDRLERYRHSFLPCLLIAVGFGVFSGPNQLFQMFSEGLKLHAVWNLFVTIFGWLLGATIIWILASIWLTIFLVSGQPLNVKLSPETIMRFRELSMSAFWFSLVYFLGVSIGNIPFLIEASTMSILDIIISPYLFFIVIGIIGILLPFYNIHTTLFKLKKKELSRIEQESEKLLQQLNEVFAKQPTTQNSDQTITSIAQTTAITARLLSLQTKEKHVQAAQEWPIDISFLSKLIGLCLIPIVSRILAMLLIS